MTLESFAHLATVVTLMILVYVQAKPTINRWATIRYLRYGYEFFDDFFVTPKEHQHSSWPERLRHAGRVTMRYVDLFLMPQADKSRLGILLPQLFRERQRPHHLPVMDGCDPLVAEVLVRFQALLGGSKEAKTCPCAQRCPLCWWVRHSFRPATTRSRLLWR